MQSYSINLVCPTRASISFCSFIILKIGLELVGLWRPCCFFVNPQFFHSGRVLRLNGNVTIYSTVAGLPFRNVVLVSYVEFLSGIPESDEQIPKFGW
jgi:hypothetical protein